MNCKYEHIIRKLQRSHMSWSPEETVLLLQMISLDGPEALEKAEFAINMIGTIHTMADNLSNLVDKESRQRPLYNARLLPLYRRYVHQLKNSGIRLCMAAFRLMLEETEFMN